MNVIRVFSLSGISVLIKMLALLGLNKVLAVYLGPSGYAAIGNFQNLLSIIYALSNGGVNTGVTKYTSEYMGVCYKKYIVWRSAVYLSIVFGFFLGLLLFIFSQDLATYFLENEDYYYVFYLLALSLFFVSFNSLLLSILNGLGEIKKYVIANIFGSVVSLLGTTFFAYFYGLNGVFVSLVLNQAAFVFFTFIICRKAGWFKVENFFGRFCVKTTLNLLKFAIVSVISLVLSQLSFIYIRNSIVDVNGWTSAGHWEAMQRLSGAYLMLATMTLSIYFLPKFAQLNNYLEIKSQIIFGQKIIFPAFLIGSSLLFFGRDFLISLLFSIEFYEMRQLFFWQLFGDFLKISSWMVSIITLSKGMFKTAIFTELAFYVFFLSLSKELIISYGAEGACLAYACSYFFYCILMYIFVYKRIGNFSKRGE